MHRRLGKPLAALGLLLTPAVGLAQGAARGDGVQALRPIEVKAAQLASQWVLGAQRQERAIADALDPEGLADEIRRLRRAVAQLQDSERAARLGSLLPGRALDRESASGALAAKLPERRQQLREGADRLASRRAALTSGLEDIPSARQRRVARAAAAKLASLEQELREAIDAPAQGRATRLGALQRRLRLDDGERSAGRTLDRTPTIRAVRRTDRPPLRVLEE